VRRSLAISAATVALAVPTVAGAAPRQIDVGDDFFAPRKPPARNFDAGPSFRWSNGGGTGNRHNVRQDDKLFFSGNLTRGPISYAINASAGSYHYYCELHGSRQGGMAGVVKVRPVHDPDPSGRPFTVIWANSGTNTGGAFDVRFKRGTGDWKIWKNDTERFRGVFGKRRRPVRVRANKVYKFQVRSERSGNHSKRSDWSPTLRVST
jgi:plastocyanin